MAIAIGIKSSNEHSKRGALCNDLKHRLLHLERYSKKGAKDNVNYLIVPSNHSVLPFPLNIKDRSAVVIKSVLELAKKKDSPELIEKSNKLSDDIVPKAERYDDIDYRSICIQFPQAWMSMAAAKSIADRLKCKLIMKDDRYRLRIY